MIPNSWFLIYFSNYNVKQTDHHTTKSRKQKIIKECLNNYTDDKKTTNGIKILGFPIECKQYIENELTKINKEVKKLSAT